MNFDIYTCFRKYLRLGIQEERELKTLPDIQLELKYKT